jgi:hypothetical protein
MTTQYKMIETKFLPVTDNRGARIAAFDNNKNRVVIAYPHELSGVDCHLKAAEELCTRLDWKGTLKGGWTKGGCAFVLETGRE